MVRDFPSLVKLIFEAYFEEDSVSVESFDEEGDEDAHEYMVVLSRNRSFGVLDIDPPEVYADNAVLRFDADWEFDESVSHYGDFEDTLTYDLIQTLMTVAHGLFWHAEGLCINE